MPLISAAADKMLQVIHVDLWWRPMDGPGRGDPQKSMGMVAVLIRFDLVQRSAPKVTEHRVGADHLDEKRLYETDKNQSIDKQHDSEKKNYNDTDSTAAGFEMFRRTGGSSDDAAVKLWPTKKRVATGCSPS